MTQSPEDPDSPESDESVDSSPSQLLTRDSDGDSEGGKTSSEIPKRSDIMRLMPPWGPAEWARCLRAMIQISNVLLP